MSGNIVFVDDNLQSLKVLAEKFKANDYKVLATGIDRTAEDASVFKDGAILYAGEQRKGTEAVLAARDVHRFIHELSQTTDEFGGISAVFIDPSWDQELCNDLGGEVINYEDCHGIEDIVVPFHNSIAGYFIWHLAYRLSLEIGGAQLFNSLKGKIYFVSNHNQLSAQVFTVFQHRWGVSYRNKSGSWIEETFDKIDRDGSAF